MHQIRLRSFDCCLPLCLRASKSLSDVLTMFDPFGPCTLGPSEGDTMAESVMHAARLAITVTRIDVPREVL